MLLCAKRPILQVPFDTLEDWTRMKDSFVRAAKGPLRQVKGDGVVKHLPVIRPFRLTSAETAGQVSTAVKAGKAGSNADS